VQHFLVPAQSAAPSSLQPTPDFHAGGAPVARLSLPRQPTGKPGEAKMTEISLALLAGDPYWAV
jgi:hypothetical protein